MNKIDYDIKHYLETSPVEDLKVFRDRLSSLNDPVFERLLKYLSNMINESAIAN